MSDWRAIARHIGTTTGEPFRPGPPRQVGGGCINTTLRLGDGARDFFIKLNGARHLPMFEAEAEGLAELDQTAAIRVPHPICHGTAGGQSYLVLEHIELRGSGDARAAGRRLARLHHNTQERFGWHRDNTIGSTPQRNTPQRDWITLWREQRLGFQLDLAERNGFTVSAL